MILDILQNHLREQGYAVRFYARRGNQFLHVHPSILDGSYSELCEEGGKLQLTFHYMLIHRSINFELGDPDLFQCVQYEIDRWIS